MGSRGGRDMLNYLKRLWTWLKEGRYLFLFLILLLFPVFMNQLDRISIGFGLQDNIRIYGLALQITGTYFVIKSLSGKLNLFEGYGLGMFLINYLKRFPLKRKSKSVVIKGETADYSSKANNARVRVSPKEDLKEVIKYFEKEINHLYGQLKETHRELNNSIGAVKRRVSEIDSKFEQKINETNKKIKLSSVSNVWEEIFGIACLILGVILATVPDYVSRFLQ